MRTAQPATLRWTFPGANPFIGRPRWGGDVEQPAAARVSVPFTAMEAAEEFDAVARPLRLLRGLPLYDLLMGLWEREADEALVAMVSEQPTDGWVIDMGPGTGLLLTLLAERFSHSRVRASDTSSAMLRACRQRLDARVPGWRGRVHLVRENALQLGVPDESSNLVFASFLLDILPASDIARALGEIRRVLRPGGAGYLAVLDARNDLRDASRGRVERRWLAVWRAVYAWLYQSPAVRALSRRLFRYTSHCHPIDLPPLVSQAEGLAVAQTRVSRIAILGLPALPVRLVKVVRS